MLRAVETDGPQTITRHGQEVAVVLNMADFRRLAGPRTNFSEHLVAFPKLAAQSGEPDVFAEVEAERQTHRAREIDLGDVE